MIALLVSLSLWAVPTARGTPPLEAALRERIARLEKDTAGGAGASPAAWTELAIAWRRLARLTGDGAYDASAARAVEAALAADPSDRDVLVLKGWVQAARHDFEGAAVSARAVLYREPSDHRALGVLADALTELGRYAEAVVAVERMMRLRPGPAAYSRAAYLRGLHGDRRGAIRLMQMAVESSSAADPEGLAWAHVMLGREHQAAGDHAAARREYERALAVVPDYHLALFHLSETQAAGGETEAAIVTLRRLYRTSPSAPAAAALGDLYLAAGLSRRAQALYREVDRIAALKDPARAEPRWLARFYADQGRNLDASIALVTQELKTHQDIETWDGLAWALHRAGRHAEALQASDRALSIGTVSARLLYHRGLVEQALRRGQDARRHLQQAVALKDLGPLELRRARQALAREAAAGWRVSRSSGPARAATR